MSLDRLKALPKKLSFKISFLYLVLFNASVFAIFLGSYVLLENSLREQDHALIKAEALEYSLLFKKGGIQALEARLDIGKKFDSPERFFVRIADNNNTTILLRLPYQWASFRWKQLESNKSLIAETWTKVTAEDQKGSLEVFTMALDDQFWIQVGKGTELRERILDRYKEVSSIILAPIVMVAFLGAIIFSYRVLSPIRDLIRVMKALDVERLNERLPKPTTKDELEELVSLFNNLLERMSNLIQAMKNSLDSVAHDLRTPITRMRGIAEMALCNDCDLNSCKEALSDCVEESEKVLRLLNAILDIAEAESGAMVLRKEEIDLRRLLGSVKELYEPVAEEKGVKIILDVPEGLSLFADQVRISQVFLNLMDNAVKYTKDETQIIVKAFEQDDMTVIQFQDQGPGIAPEDISRIWTWFYRSDTSRSMKGLGIGLAIVKAVVDAHRGSVGVENVNGNGTRFIIKVPRPPTQLLDKKVLTQGPTL